MKMKREELKKQDKVSTQVNKITSGDLLQVFRVTKSQMQHLIQAFGVTKDQMQKVAKILSKDKTTEKLGNSSPSLPKGYGPVSYKDSAEKMDKEVLFIHAENTKGTTFKVKVEDHVFSS